MGSDTTARATTRTPVRTASDLVTAGLIEPEHAAGISRLLDEFALAITPSVAETIASADPSGGVARQFVPTLAEMVETADELTDPIGDDAHSPIKGIVHRYPDRVLLKPVHVCPVYCRFCFRRERVGPGGEALTKAELSAALDYIRADPEIWEVILSGGDPLVLSPRRLADIRDSLEAIDHVRVVRIHSRVPVVDPLRVTPALVGALRRPKPTYIVIHANHADEFTEAARSACARLADAGLPLLSQSVLLRGVNDEPASLARLLRTFVENRIKPYYLHHCDLARGTGHFRTSIADGQQLMRTLRGRISGLCQPTYVLDIPGGHGKVPVGPSYLETGGEGRFDVRDLRGTHHSYQDADARADACDGRRGSTRRT